MKRFFLLMGLAVAVAVLTLPVKCDSGVGHGAVDAENELARYLDETYVEQQMAKDGNKCPLSCTQEYNPVCATNGVTYQNPCWMGIAVKCDGKTELGVAHAGVCR